MSDNIEGLLCRNLIMETVDGEKIEFKNAVINEISDKSNTIERCNSYVVSHKYELSVTVENLTKKKFIKLLMAKGIARNGAKDIALYIHKKYGCYNTTHLLII